MNYRRIKNDQSPSILRIECWLKQRIAVKIVSQLGIATVSFIGGCLILAIIYFLTYAVIWFGFNYGVSAFCQLVFDKSLQIPPRWISVICWLFLGILFVEHFRVNREYWTSYSVKGGTSASLIWFAGIFGAFAALLGNLDASGKMIADMLLCGPRLIAYSLMETAKGLRNLQFDSKGCAAALTVLLERKTRISLSELVGLLATRSPINVLFQIQDIEGVVILNGDPVGIILSEELRDELTKVVDLTKSDNDVSLDQERVPHEDNNYNILGLTPPCSSAEVKLAYRQCIKDCHPDRFRSDAPEVRLWAEERAKAVNAAYESLLTELEQSKAKC